MGTTALAAEALLPEAELARMARILSRYITGDEPNTGASSTTHRTAGQGMDFLDFRQYQPGDDLRIIDWRASARNHKVQVRRYSTDVASDWYLCVDSSASMGVDAGANWALASRLTAALSYVLLHLGNRVGLLVFSDEIETACGLGRGYYQYAQIIKTLKENTHRAVGGGSDPGVCAALAGRHHPMMIISDFLAPDAMVSTLATLRAGGRPLHLFQLDAACPPLPESDFLPLQDVESGSVAMCGDPGAARAEANRQLLQLQQDLAAWARRARIAHTVCGSHDNWRELLLRHFIAG